MSSVLIMRVYVCCVLCVRACACCVLCACVCVCCVVCVCFRSTGTAERVIHFFVQPAGFDNESTHTHSLKQTTNIERRDICSGKKLIHTFICSTQNEKDEKLYM